MERVLDVLNLDWRWERDGDEYTVYADDEKIVELLWPDGQDEAAEGRTEDECWSFHRGSTEEPRVIVKPYGFPDPITRFDLDRYGATMPIRDIRYRFGSVGDTYAWQSPEGQPIIRYRPDDNGAGTIDLRPVEALEGDLPLLVTLGLYLIAAARERIGPSEPENSPHGYAT